MALYRKYRPSTFSDVVGQDIIINILQNSIINNKVGHAYLFSGPRGTGKTSVAKIFAKAVNCLSPKNGDVCNKCEMCQILSVNPVDIIEIDAASNNGVDEIREIRNNAKLLPSIAKYKIYIIDEVHMLSTGAFNALLKTLEEPPEHVIFILATTEVQKIPLTIISRCQRFDFRKIVPSVLKERLLSISKKEKKTIDGEVFDLICKLSDGGLRDAINLLDQIITIKGDKVTSEDIYLLSGDVNEKTIKQLFDDIINNNLVSGLTIINDLYLSGKNFLTVADRLLLFTRDIIVNNNINDYFNSKYSKVLDNYRILSNDLCKAISKTLIELISELKKSNNQKIVFEIYFINLCTLSEELCKENVFNPVTIEKSESIPKIESVSITIEEKELKSFKYIRINNVLAEADKNILKNLNSKYGEIQDYISSKIYNNIAKILMDGKIVAASEEYVLYSFPKENITSVFYNNLKQIEKLMEKIYKKQYNVVAVSENEWNNIKKEYIKNKKEGNKYYKVEETSKPNVIQQDVSEVENEAINLFGEESVSVK